MTTVRQTVTTVQSQQSQQGRLDNSLDALLEDLQTSVSRTPSSTMNGLGGTAGRSYREVTRTVQQEPLPREYHVTRTVQQEVLPHEYREIPRNYREVTHRTVQQETLPRDYQQVVTRTVQQETVPQVQYLSAANPTTVVQERASSPMNPGEQRNVTAYKTVSYQYKSSDKQQPVSGPIVDSKVITSKSASDERLQQNLTELDSLLVDLHQAQKTGFGSPQGGSTTTTRTEVVTSGIDSGLLEPVNHSTPAPPARQQQHISRSVQYKYNTQQYETDGTSPVRYQIETPSPRLQPKRSSSANRELTYGPNEPGHTRTTRSPSPMRQRDLSPLDHQNTSIHKEVYYENKSNSNVVPSGRSQTMPHEHYREKSPSNERLRRELYYETKTTNSVPSSSHYRETSPPPQRRGTSPLPPIQTISSSPEPFPGQPGGTSRITTVRTYNYTTNSTGTPPPPTSRSPYPSVAPSPIPVSKSPYPETVTVTELSPSPHRSPTASSPEGYPPPHQTLPPGVLMYPPPPQIPGQPPTKVITTVHTYTYEIPGQPGVNHPYPPPPGTTTTTYVNSLPPDAPEYPGPGDRTLTYHVSPQLPREKEPLLPQEPPTVIHTVEPQQPPTVITYKYTSHTTNNKYPGGPPQPEEQQPLLPRPFPTSSPPPGQPAEGQPPKRLDDLMASFGDPKEPGSPPSYYKTEKTVTTTTTRHPPPEGNGVAIVPPSSPVMKTAEKDKTSVKEREKTINKPGPPVYYPPGVELFAKKEESMMTQGSKKASGSGKYKYESESKSKSSSGGGAAVVPVCLPLCCAMPCVIL